MGAMDVYCMPGWVGLSIVDAFFMGLPLVTQDGPHPPEICYLKNDENGYILPEGDVELMASVLGNILFDDKLRERLSKAAVLEYRNNAHIDRMCDGFYKALNYACAEGRVSKN
jgi:glycosyltransferase involved in cell wall biosynthesis